MAAPRPCAAGRWLVAMLLLSTLLNTGCAQTVPQLRKGSEAGALDTRSKILKAHMRDGSRYEVVASRSLRSWSTP